MNWIHIYFILTFGAVATGTAGTLMEKLGIIQVQTVLDHPLGIAMVVLFFSSFGILFFNLFKPSTSKQTKKEKKSELT